MPKVATKKFFKVMLTTSYKKATETISEVTPKGVSQVSPRETPGEIFGKQIEEILRKELIVDVLNELVKKN